MDRGTVDGDGPSTLSFGDRARLGRLGGRVARIIVTESVGSGRSNGASQ
jgi:hypothetical protein